GRVSVRRLGVAADALAARGAALADEEQLGFDRLALLRLAEPEPASPPGQVEDAVVARRQIEPDGALGPVDARRQAGHRMLQGLEAPGRPAVIGPGLEAAFRPMLVMVPGLV